MGAKAPRKAKPPPTFRPIFIVGVAGSPTVMACQIPISPIISSEISLITTVKFYKYPPKRREKVLIRNNNVKVITAKPTCSAKLASMPKKLHM